MFSLISVVALILTSVLVVSHDLENSISLTKFDHFVKVPASTLRTGGRISERQIGYIAESGYASILSVSEFFSNDTSYNGVEGAYPSSEYEVEIAASYNMSADFIASNLTLESLAVITKKIDTMKKPIYIHCHVSYICSYIFTGTILLF